MFQLPDNQENPFGIAKKSRTGVSQLKLFAVLSEKLDVKILLKGLNLHGNCRLGNMKRIGGLGDAFFSGGQVKRSKLV
jgi:hypothetical protein